MPKKYVYEIEMDCSECDTGGRSQCEGMDEVLEYIPSENTC